MRRRELQAYLIGAAVAGTALILPYAGRSLASVVLPNLEAADVPFFLLPIVWGIWNLLWVRLGEPLAAPLWGALLGVLVAMAVNTLLAVRDQWYPAQLLLVPWIPVLYAIGWTFIIVPLNRAFDVHA